MHAELCLLEAFEVEASHMLADMPDLNSSDPQTRPSNFHAQEEFANQIGGELPPSLIPEKPMKEVGGGGKGMEEEYGDREIRKPMSYRRPWSSLPGDSRTIESGSGLKLVVSVERPEEGEGEGEGDEEEDVEEDVSVPASPHRPRGALANGDEDMYKPKMECPTCGLVLYRHNFSTHYRIHTGEMPFQCTYCDKRFRTTSALKVHVRAHTGEKPYVCPRCNYACITKRNLDRHIINNHVREGVRRGPRYRRSRYRLNDPQYEEYMVDMARKDSQDQDPAMDDNQEFMVEDHGHEGEIEEEEEGEDMGGKMIEEKEEEESPRRSARQHSKKATHFEMEHSY